MLTTKVPERRVNKLQDERPRPTVSVIVPCYNYGRFLPSCVGSILSQPKVDVSVLIIDDCSTDDSHAIARRLAEQDKRVEVVRHQANRGHIATYNEGLDWADAEYTVLLSADDLLAPGALRRATTVFSAHPEVGMVYGRAVFFADGTRPPRPRASDTITKVWSGPEWVATRCRWGRTGIESPEVMLRTEVQRRIGGYRADLPHTADMEMWLRAAHHADVAFVCADQAYRRTHSAMMSVTRFGSIEVDYAQRQLAFQAALLNDDRRLPHADELYAAATRAVAADALWRLCRCYGAGAADDVDCDAVLTWAASICPELAELPESGALAWRRHLGGWARYVHPLTLPSMVRRRLRRLHHQYGTLWWRHLRYS